jgi:tRNA modification GTPase
MRLSAAPIGRVLFGRWRVSADASEDVVVCRRAECEWEVHCHGGRMPPASIVQSLVDGGARAVTPENWLTRSSPDRLTAEAKIALWDARTECTAAILLDQTRGALSQQVQKTIEWLRNGQWRAAELALTRLEQLSSLGMHLTQPWRIVVAGAPNVGKSCLTNQLLGYQRCIVIDEPGTTRDVLTAHTAFDGWPAELRDTAGLRSAQDPVESAGIARAVKEIHAADLVLLVLDVTAGTDHKIRELCVAGPPTILVGNKVDLLVAGQSHPACDVLVSATTGQGIPRLIERIVQQWRVDPPLQPGESVPFQVRHVTAIKAARQLLATGATAAAADLMSRLQEHTVPPTRH